MASRYTRGRRAGRSEIALRRREYFEPYHGAIREEIGRLRAAHRVVVVYDCHSIRSQVPRLFPGTLPHFNIGTNTGISCDAALTAPSSACDTAGLTRVTNGRFRGGYTTRHYGAPETACMPYRWNSRAAPTYANRR